MAPIPYTRVQGYLDFIKQVPIPQSDIDFFTTKPCAEPYLRSSSPYHPVPFISRYEKEDTSDRFFSQIVHSSTTIPHLLAVMRKEDWTDRATAALTTTRRPTTHLDEPDLVLFLHLESYLNGFRDTLHGGVLAALLDEALGTCIEGFKQSVLGENTRLYTANLTVSYRAPVETPGTVLIKTWLTKREGRKWFLEAQLVGEDGKLRTEANGLWILQRTEERL